jgi:hypothetical protein
MTSWGDNGVMGRSTEREGSTNMAKKITPTNPDAKATIEDDAKDTAAAERKTASIHWNGRKTARKASNLHIGN